MTSFESMTQAGTALAVIISGILQYLKTRKVERKTEETKQEVQATKQEVTATKAEVKVVKVLVDGSLSSEYQISATSARTLAEVTKKQEHRLLADQAEARLREHLAKMSENHVKKGESK
jgi:phage shock protein A